MTTPEHNKKLVLEAFDTLFNKRDYAAAEQFSSARYIQHSAHIAPGRAGLFDLIRSLPATLRYEHQVVLAEGDHVMLYGRFSGNGDPAASVAADVVRIENGALAEHWDVLQNEATPRRVRKRPADVRRRVPARPLRTDRMARATQTPSKETMPAEPDASTTDASQNTYRPSPSARVRASSPSTPGHLDQRPGPATADTSTVEYGLAEPPAATHRAPAHFGPDGTTAQPAQRTALLALSRRDPDDARKLADEVLADGR